MCTVVVLFLNIIFHFISDLKDNTRPPAINNYEEDTEDSDTQSEFAQGILSETLFFNFTNKLFEKKNLTNLEV